MITSSLGFKDMVLIEQFVSHLHQGLHTLLSPADPQMTVIHVLFEFLASQESSGNKMFVANLMWYTRDKGSTRRITSTGKVPNGMRSDEFVKFISYRADQIALQYDWFLKEDSQDTSFTLVPNKVT